MALRQYISPSGIPADRFEGVCSDCGAKVEIVGDVINTARNNGETTVVLPCGHAEPLGEE